MACICGDGKVFCQEDFRRDYEKYGDDDVLKQVPHLARLADVYLKKARQNLHKEHNWLNYVKAHALINSCLARDDREQHWHSKIYSIEREFYGDSHTLTEDEHLNMTKSLKKKLVSLRLKTKKLLESVTAEFSKLDLHDIESSNNRKTMKKVEELMFGMNDNCTSAMLQLVASVIQESEKIINSGPPPPYCAVALGSLARGEATPFSDLEYLFLISNNEQVEYFKKLAIDTYFRIGNFGETPLKCMYLEEIHDKYQYSGEKRWFLESIITNGFKIDGFTPRAGNIPTGNGLSSGCKFIKTPQQLLFMFSTSLNSAINPNLPGDTTHLLASMEIIHSNRGAQLFKDIQSKLRDINITEDRQEVINKRINTLREDLLRYDYVPKFRSNLLNPKQQAKTDICRYPSLLIYNLSLLHRIEASKPWQVLNVLLSKRILSEELHTDLSRFLASALYIRLSAYLKHNSQKEMISFLPGIAKTPSDMYHLPQQVAIPVTLFILKVKRPTPTPVARLLQIAEAWAAWGETDNALKTINEGLNIENMEETVQILENACSTKSEIVNHLLLIRDVLSPMEGSELSLQYMRKIREYETDFESLSATDVEICFNLIELKRWDQVESLISKSYERLLILASNYGIEIQDSHTEEEKLNMLKIIMNRLPTRHDEEGFAVGSTPQKRLISQWNVVCWQSAKKYHEIHQPSAAIEYYQLITQLLQKTNFEGMTCAYILALSSLAYNYGQISKFKRAEKYYKQANEAFKCFYGENYTSPQQNQVMQGLVNAERELGKYGSADEILDYMKRIHQGDQQQSGYSYYSSARLLSDQGLYTQSIEECEKSLELLTDSKDVKTIARIHYQLGNCYLNLDQYKEAAHETELSLKLYHSIQHTELDQRDIATAKHQLGMVCLNSGYHMQAEKYFRQSLAINREVHGEEHHAVASDYQCLAAVTLKQGKYEEAEHLLRISAPITACVYGDRKCDPELAKTHLLLGQVYKARGDTRKAFAEILKAVTMMECKFGYKSQHPNLLSMRKQLLHLSQLIQLRRRSKHEY